MGGASEGSHYVILTHDSFIGTGDESAGFRIFKEKLETWVSYAYLCEISVFKCWQSNCETLGGPT